MNRPQAICTCGAGQPDGIPARFRDAGPFVTASTAMVTARENADIALGTMVRGRFARAVSTFSAGVELWLADEAAEAFFHVPPVLIPRLAQARAGAWIEGQFRWVLCPNFGGDVYPRLGLMSLDVTPGDNPFANA